MLRCEHGVFLPAGQKKAWGCQGCYPHGHPIEEQGAPVFNRRGALKLTSTGKLPKCPKCQVPVSVAIGGCVVCGTQFNFDGDEKLRANNRQSGICPECGSGVHVETKDAKTWGCADCGTEYPASRSSEE